MTRLYELRGDNEVLCVKGAFSFLLAGKAGKRFPLCIETFEEEYCQTLEADDIIAVSAPEGGSQQAAGMLLELVRTHHIPLVVLPGSHPGSKRLKYVVSAGGEIHLNCSITRGTHPEQHLLCSSEELAGISLTKKPGAVEISSLPSGIEVHRILTRDTLSFP
ncbi:MAG TPA: alpha/beta hydrolase [Methanoregulaceae archaeon]|nr:alpha/beta hydrolase [Methanoregulaceae archaeon]